MGRLWFTSLAIAPALILLLFWLRPELDRAWPQPLAHFYVVTFTTFAAAVVSLLLWSSLRRVARPRHALAAVAFAAIGAIFFLHGILTPGALRLEGHPAIAWSAWLVFLIGGLVFAYGSLDQSTGDPLQLPAAGRIKASRVAALVACGVVAYQLIALLAPHWLVAIDEQAGPVHQTAIFFASFLLWFLAGFNLWRSWQSGNDRIDATLALVAFWMAISTVSLHQFGVWQLSWWVYHFVLLIAFLLTVIVLAADYEQARSFRLARYYLALSLILTALLGLVAAALVGRFSGSLLRDEIGRGVLALVDAETDRVRQSLDSADTAPEALGRYARELELVTMGDGRIYTLDGTPVTGASSAAARFEAAEGDAYLGQPALRDAPLTDVLPRIREAKAWVDFAPSDDGLLGVVVYTPLLDRAGDIVGFLRASRPTPEIEQGIVAARQVGLGTAALTMGALFLLLFFIVRRGDRILSSRTEELAMAYENLQRLEAVREDLINMIVHDLRNPLTIISANLDILRRRAGVNGDVQQELLARTRGASGRMDALIDDILTVSKLEAGQLQLNLSDVRLATLLSERLADYRSRAAAEGKALDLSCPPDLRATVDARMIGRVVDNLLSNAFKFTVEDHGRIDISARRDDGRIVVRVHDNGEGVPDAYKEEIFAKFGQVPSGDTAVRRGTGLGLAFCRLIIRAHGGDISVADAPEGGSEFCFWLPV